MARVGLTFDLRSAYLAMGYGEEETAEFDREETIDALAGTLEGLGHDVDRIGHVRALVGALAAGRSWDVVFNICEGLRGYGREAQVPAVLEAYGIPYTFAEPLVAALTLHKGLTKRVLRDAGVPTTDFHLVHTLADVETVRLAFPLFCKPVAEGTAKGIHPQSRVSDREALRAVCGDLLERYRQPVLVEPYLPGREFTTGLIGRGRGARVVGTLEIQLVEGKAEAHAYTYRNKEESEERCALVLAGPPWADRCAEIALAAWETLGCRGAGRVDLRADAEGNLMVLELNPLPGMHPTHSDLPMLCAAVGIPYAELVAAILQDALSP